ncbi:MAG: hypothetical protein ACTHMR_21555 [Thermomicrobiales bacterium]
MPTDEERTPRTSLNVSEEEMAILRDIAATLGYYTTRGPGAGRRGNVTMLMRALAEAGKQNQAFTVATLAGLLQSRLGDGDQ